MLGPDDVANGAFASAVVARRVHPADVPVRCVQELAGGLVELDGGGRIRQRLGDEGAQCAEFVEDGVAWPPRHAQTLSRCRVAEFSGGIGAQQRCQACGAAASESVEYRVAGIGVGRDEKRYRFWSDLGGVGERAIQSAPAASRHRSAVEGLQSAGQSLGGDPGTARRHPRHWLIRSGKRRRLATSRRRPSTRLLSMNTVFNPRGAPSAHRRPVCHRPMVSLASATILSAFGR